jgi:predicted HAD superfamily Cof-like phosphohydrolase
MKVLDALNQVAEFHRTFKHPIKKAPAIPEKKRCDLRVALIREELEELEAAIENNDLVEVADALCDIQYVLSGAVLEFGMGEKFRDLFDEVQRSNMSKSCATKQEAEATVKYYKEKRGMDCFYREVDGHFSGLSHKRQQNSEIHQLFAGQYQKHTREIAISPAQPSTTAHRIHTSSGGKNLQTWVKRHFFAGCPTE